MAYLCFRALEPQFLHSPGILFNCIWTFLSSPLEGTKQYIPLKPQGDQNFVFSSLHISMLCKLHFKAYWIQSMSSWYWWLMGSSKVEFIFTEKWKCTLCDCMQRLCSPKVGGEGNLLRMPAIKCRVPGSLLKISCWCCYNKTPVTGWLNNKHLFFIVMETRKSKHQAQGDSVSGKSLPPSS